MNTNILDIYPLSPMQQGMLFHTLLSPESEVYTEQLSCKLNGSLDVDAFRNAWNQIVNRHDILRSAFVWEDLDEPLQVVHESSELPFTLLDWTDKPAADHQQELNLLMKAEREKGFELNEAPLMRLMVIKLGSTEHYFIWSYHHLLFDGWGLPIILEEIFKLYDSLVKSETIELPPVRPYRDYIAWLKQQDMDQAREYWQRQLEDFTDPSILRIGQNPRPGVTGYDKERLIFSEHLSEQFRLFVKQHKLTLNTLIQGAWALCLQSYSGNSDVLFGATVSGRPAELSGVERMIGLFINTLPVRAQINEEINVTEWLKSLQMQQAQHRQYEYSPLVAIQGWSSIPRSMPLFESIVVFENYPVGDSLDQNESSLKISDVTSFERTNYPLTLVAAPGKVLAVDLAYETSRFGRTTAKRILSHLQKVMTAIITEPESCPSDLSILPEQERKTLISDWNNTSYDFKHPLIVHQWFEQQVSRTPDSTAIVFGEDSISYAALNKEANRLAHYLIRKGVSRETLVGICLRRNPSMIISLLAVIKAGGAYVPIDPEYPQDRINYMIDDSGLEFLITESVLSDRFIQKKINFIHLDTDHENIQAQSDINPQNKSEAENLAYVIYTSGSTGTPKGVLLRHKGLSNLIGNTVHDFSLNSNSHVLQLSSFSFDASVAEIFAALLSGATLHLILKETALSTEDLGTYIRENKITFATLPPSLITLLPAKAFKDMDTLVSVGDTCSWDLFRKLKDQVHFINGYGPTEISVGCAWGEVKKERSDSGTVPIGRPLKNTAIYILDAALDPMPIGVPGEIYVGGEGVGRGYHNKPDLTADKFVPDPFSDKAGARLYKTGDLARFLVDGSIEFLGRVDFQVKLRGFRVELGEIEEALKQIPAVADAAVILREDQPGDKRIVGYLLPEKDSELLVQEIRDDLKSRLPDFMVPSALLVMDAFPMTPSGKIDRKKLPAPEQSDFTADDDFIAPQNPEQEILAGIWKDILNLPQIGIHSNFFDLGGHSLMATQVISRVKDAFQVDLPLRVLFESPTIAQLSLEIEQLKQADYGLEMPPIEVVNRDQDLPLSFAQQRLWFLDQLEPGNTSYNIPTVMKLKGALDPEHLQKSFEQVISRHEALRTTFINDQGTPFQKISDSFMLELEVNDLTKLSVQEQPSELRKIVSDVSKTVFDFSQLPLFDVRIVKLADDEHVLVFVVHHIVADGWSVSILVNEVAAHYEALQSGHKPELPALKVQYADYATWQKNWLKDEILEKQINYWREQLAGIPPLLEIPTDRPRPAVQSFNGAVENIHISADLSDAIKRLSQQSGVTPFMTLLAAFQTLLHRYSRQEDILVGSPIANRTNSEIEHLIGFFVNTLVFRTRFDEDPSFEELLKQVREIALGAYAHQHLPFEKLVEEIQPVRDMSHSPLFQVAFVYQNIPPGKRIELSGLSIEALEPETETTNYDLTFTLTESDKGLSGSMEYNTDLFDQSTVQRILNHFNTLLTRLIAQPDEPVSQLPLMSRNDTQDLLTSWNQTDWTFPSEKCVHEWFEEYSEQQPEAPALLYKENSAAELRELNYSQLNEKANQLARYLQKSGLGREDLAGICIERSPEMIISILAVLKSGAAFIPIDPTYPEDRIRYMIEDSGIKVLITSEKINQHLPGHKAQTVILDHENANITSEDTANLDISLDPDNLAYVIYTSGSTGKPKGTMLRHRGLCNLASAQMKAFGVGPGSRIMQFSSLSFDAAVWEFAMAMLSGSALCLTSAETIAAGNELVNILEDMKVTTITLPPSVLTVLPQRELPELSTIITAGEAVSGELVDRWGKNRRFFNAYGPTETTVCASMHLCEGRYPQGPPIGLPIANFKLYVLDTHLNPVPIGVPGELCIAGMGLARGYLNRPDLSAEKFVPDPFSDEPGSRLYRSGDLVRYLPDGNIEFLGRIDQQVKVRGFRIELGEIESVLDQHDEIAGVYVMAREDRPGDKRLVAYLVQQNQTEVKPADLKLYLKDRLPEYMVPSAFVTLERFPLTPSGKIDRHALPVPEISRDELTSEYVAPRNEDETKLVSIVGDLLNISRVGIHDNFFELGGHSLLATQFISRIRDQFGVELPLRSLFEHPSALEIVEEIRKVKSKPDKKEEIPAIKRVSRAGRTVKRKDLDG